MASAPKKRGKLSNEEMAFIREYSRKMPKERIAQELNRTIEPIERYIAEQGLSTNTEDNDRQLVKKRLMNKYFWKSIEDQLQPEEIDYFVNGWIDLSMTQFGNDVTATDEQDIKQLLLFEIQKNRCGKQRRIDLETVDKYQKEYMAEEAKGQLADPATLQIKMELKTQAQTAVSVNVQEMDKYVKSCDDILKRLKSTRDQRLKQVESGQNTFMSVLKFLEDKKNRELEGRKAELESLAADKKTKELYELHQFGDGTLDPPILNSESSKMHKERELKDEQEKRDLSNKPEETDKE